jgi:hypothetical protein
MATNPCPAPESRNRDDDLTILACAVVKDRLSFNADRLSAHVADTTDLLVGYVETALGLKIRIDWANLPDSDLPAVKAWQTYCTDLFDSVGDFVVKAILATTGK